MENDSTKYYSIAPPDGMTRKCLDAWGKCFVKSNGDVWLCCNGTLVGNIKNNELFDILNNAKSQAYRKGLLDGDPLPICKQCIDKPICTVEVLSTAVRAFYQTGQFDY